MRCNLQYAMMTRCFEQKADDSNYHDVLSTKTQNVYRYNISRFVDWAKEHGYKSYSENIEGKEQTVIKAYLHDLTEHGYTPSSCHTFIAPVARALNISLNDIDMPTRTSSSIVRSRDTVKNERGKAEEQKEEYARLVDFQKATGIRRNELEHLTAKDYRWDGNTDDHRELYINVERGKGGKQQWQRILPEDVHTVLSIMEDSKGDRVFSPEEMDNHIDLHGMRADHAKVCYDYYKDMLKKEPQLRQEWIAKLKTAFREGNMDQRLNDPKAYSKHYTHFLQDIGREGSVYRLRGEVLDAARRQGLPAVYDRLPLMMVSVYHLAHWRLDVTIEHYMI